MPSDVFREHILTCFIADPIGLALRDEIGIDNICWEQDYPHSDSSWPDAPEELATMAARYDVSDADLDKMTHENAMRWYRFDPFAHRPDERVHRRRAARRGRRPRRVDPRRWTRAATPASGADDPRRARRPRHRLTHPDTPRTRRTRFGVATGELFNTRDAKSACWT